MWSYSTPWASCTTSLPRRCRDTCRTGKGSLGRCQGTLWRKWSPITLVPVEERGLVAEKVPAAKEKAPAVERGLAAKEKAPVGKKVLVVKEKVPAAEKVLAVLGAVAVAIFPANPRFPAMTLLLSLVCRRGLGMTLLKFVACRLTLVIRF